MSGFSVNSTLSIVVENVTSGRIVCLDPGHTTPPNFNGAPGPPEWAEMPERVANRLVVEGIAVILRRAGLLVTKTLWDMDGSGRLSLGRRSDIAIKAKASAFISVHHDLFIGNSAASRARNQGMVLFGGVKTADVRRSTKRFGDCITNSLNKSLWYKFKEGTFSEIAGKDETFTNLLLKPSNAGIPSVLVECNYMSAQKYTDKAKAEGWDFIAKPIAQGVIEFFNS